MKKSPKILFFDIETAPNIAMIWRTGYKISVGPEAILEERKVICIAWKWAGEAAAHCEHWDSNSQNDKFLLKRFMKELEKADLVITQNGDRFDLPWLRGRLLYHGLPPCPKITSLDTFKLSKKAFNLNSYKLDYLGQFLKIGKKNPMNFGDWKKVILDKDAQALEKMIKYCKKDVVLLEKLFNKIKPHTNMAAHMGLVRGRTNVSCPNCGGHRLQSRGKIVNKMFSYKRLQCQECGSWSKGERIKEYYE